MKKSSGKSGLGIKAGIKAGGVWANHNRKVASAMAIKTALKAGSLWTNHNRKIASALSPRSSVTVTTGVETGGLPSAAQRVSVAR